MHIPISRTSAPWPLSIIGCVICIGAIACSSSDDQGPRNSDAASTDAPVAPADAGGTELVETVTPGIDAAPMAKPDGPGPDGDGGNACYWKIQGARYSLKHFKFNLTTPDGPAGFSYPFDDRYDAGPPKTHDFEGRIVSKNGNQFTVDSCVSSSSDSGSGSGLDAGSCQPSLYQFTLCDGPVCQAQTSTDGIALAVPIGRRVRVVWHLDMDVISFSPGLYWLAIYDAETAATKDTILFLGSGGRDPRAGSWFPNYFADLPFSVTVKPLYCGQPVGDARSYGGDDYAFLFTPKAGGTPLQLGTRESGTLEFTSTAGKQALAIHCLLALQSGSTDDYWNWEFWAATTDGSTD